ncbi:MAG: GntR family transcriptional regulator [Balneolaceae bacterium]|nr:GntR family transcriptional regulator [Balneolaceae bacterium]MCH8548778.1 GntR family transcriptional regulator [Balneolaceae bacterium]
MKLKEGIPRHSQISRWLRNQIEEGNYKPDEKLPSENELAKKFNVSRVTIRRALQSLESESIIYRCQGLGSFVSDDRAPHNLIRLTDFNEDMSKAGLEASSLVREFKTIEAPSWLADILDIEEGTKVIQIDRLRLGDGEPVAFDSTWLPILYGQLLDEKSLRESTIYKVLEENYDIPIVRGCYRISAEICTAELETDLKVPEHSPLLLIDRISYTIGNKPVYYQKRYYRTDKVLYEMTLERDKNGSSPSGDMPLKEFIPVFKS